MEQLPQVVQAAGDGALVGVGVLQVLIGNVGTSQKVMDRRNQYLSVSRLCKPGEEEPAPFNPLESGVIQHVGHVPSVVQSVSVRLLCLRHLALVLQYVPQVSPGYRRRASGNGYTTSESIQQDESRTETRHEGPAASSPQSNVQVSRTGSNQQTKADTGDVQNPLCNNKAYIEEQSAKDLIKGTASMDQSKLSLSGHSSSHALATGRWRKEEKRLAESESLEHEEVVHHRHGQHRHPLLLPQHTGRRTPQAAEHPAPAPAAAAAAAAAESAVPGVAEERQQEEQRGADVRPPDHAGHRLRVDRVGGEEQAGEEAPRPAAEERAAEGGEEGGDQAVQRHVEQVVAPGPLGVQRVVEAEGERAQGAVGLVAAAVREQGAPEVVKQDVGPRRLGKQVLARTAHYEIQTWLRSPSPLPPRLPLVGLGSQYALVINNLNIQISDNHSSPSLFLEDEKKASATRGMG
ncbi:hypothetical protein EYF80_045198 [Liparis tanakae]|uniref:Uncharacterized protein n=1 Tax=Liparis tanakae TaxID=230148 RepID=A0A4Z2FTP7_9TELE|nr:hypothetical protein EYF80_045198 [Liparis tanakae]